MGQGKELLLRIKNRHGKYGEVAMSRYTGEAIGFMRSLLDAILAMPGYHATKSFGGFCYRQRGDDNDAAIGYRITRFFEGSPSSHPRAKERFSEVKSLSDYQVAAEKEVFIDGIDFSQQDWISFDFLVDGKIHKINLGWMGAVSLFITMSKISLFITMSKNNMALFRDLRENPNLLEFNELECEQYLLEDIVPFAKRIHYDFLFKFEDIVGDDGEKTDADEQQHQEPSVVKSVMQWVGRMISFRSRDRHYRYGALSGAGVSRGMAARLEGADSASKTRIALQQRAEGKISMNEAISKDQA